MARVGTVALQGSSRGLLSPLLLFFLFYTTISGSPAQAADGQAACRFPFARVVSIQGTIEVLRSGGTNWARVAQLDTSVCPGDRLRSGPQSRAALFVQPETLVRVDQNTSVTISQTDDETLVELTQEDVVAVSAGAHACGAGYFITRFPRKFKVKTPHLNAAVEGTEFLVAMRCESTDLSVIEGKVLAAGADSNVFPPQSVVSGQTLTVGGSEPPVIKLQLKPADAVQWTLYYPPITPAGIEPAEDCRVVAQDNRLSCLIARAEQFLRAGRVEDAQANIADALTVAPYSSDAKALSSIISLIKNDKAEALRLAKESVDTTPNSAPAWLALSYAQQADFKLEAALSSAKRAAELTPSSALALARVAELQLSLGWTREAEKIAKQAVATNPSESRTHMILGFVHLAQINVKEASKDFERAIELDSTDPLSRLGLGLAIIRTGHLNEGREQIEIAVALDPTNSLLRSYVGKAYYEENSKERDQLASVQFGLAKQLDPNDPTPWFYDAMLRQSQNTPVDALEALQKSIELNGNRAVDRSRFFLDDDVASKNASVAAIYTELGFEKLAIVESAKALADSYGNYSAHRMLAEAYLNIPRHDIARVSEALQAQIRQPLSLPLVDSLISNDNLLMLHEVTPARLSQTEYSLLFNRNQARIQFDAFGGNRATFGDQFVIEGLGDKMAASITQLHYQTDGFSENNAATRDLYDLFVQAQLSYGNSVQIDAKHSEFEAGQTFFSFDPSSMQPSTIRDSSDGLRMSGHHLIDSRSDWIWSVASQTGQRIAQTFPDAALINQTDIVSSGGEVQYLLQSEIAHVISGAGYINQDEQFPLSEGAVVRTQGADGYVYGQWTVLPSLVLIAGAAAEWFRLTNPFFPNAIDRQVISPKLGLVWSPGGGTTVRAAAFQAVRRPFIGSQTIEPTQVAGFNQFFTGIEQFYGDIEGTISRRVGLAIDQSVSRTAFVGAEVTARELKVPSIIADRDFTWREATARAYLYKAYPARSTILPSNLSAATSLEIQFEHIERPQILTGPEGIMHLDTVMVPMGVKIFDNQGVTFGAGLTYVRQQGDFSIDEGLPVFNKNDAAWITDLFVESRFPKRSGALVLGVRNLFDQSLDLVETDPINPRVATGRFYYLKATVTF
jgi:tetratricopeptide (TPR) repeat protein